MSDEEKVKYVLELDVPGLPNGEGVEIPGLGVFQNGSTYEITETEASDYRSRNPVAVAETGKHNEILSVTVEDGKTLLQESRKMMEGITVSTYKPDDDQEDQVDDTPEDEEPEEGQQLVEDAGMQLDEGSDD